MGTDDSQGSVCYDSARDGVAVLEINNIPRRNAITCAMWDSLRDKLQSIRRGQDRLRVLLIRGAGEVAFSAGSDIAEFAKTRADADSASAYDRIVEETVRELETIPLISVAEIHGVCFGAGLSVAMACDFRLCDETATFSLPAVRHGLGYNVSGISRVVRLVGVTGAREILLTGQPIKAQRAKEIGLINELVKPPLRLEEEVWAFAEMLKKNAPLAVAAIKSTLGRLAEIDANEYVDCQRLLSACNASADYKEGLAAFREKRPPRFLGS